MTDKTRFIATICLTGSLLACSDETPSSEEASGGEEPGALEEAKESVDEAHENFKEAIEPAADFVDEKANAIVDEGKKVVGAEDEPEGDAPDK